MSSPVFEPRHSLNTPISEVSACDSLLQEFQEFEAQVYSGELFDALSNQAISVCTNATNSATQDERKPQDLSLFNTADENLGKSPGAKSLNINSLNHNVIQISNTSAHLPKCQNLSQKNVEIENSRIPHLNPSIPVIPIHVSTKPSSLIQQKQQSNCQLVTSPADTRNSNCPSRVPFLRSSTPVNYNEDSKLSYENPLCLEFTEPKDSVEKSGESTTQSEQICDKHQLNSNSKNSLDEDPIIVHDMVVAKMAASGLKWGPPLLQAENTKFNTECGAIENDINCQGVSSLNTTFSSCNDQQYDQNQHSTANLNFKMTEFSQNQEVQNQVTIKSSTNILSEQHTDPAKSLDEQDLKTQLEQAMNIRKQQDAYIKQLQTYYDNLLTKHALAEVTIDQLRMGMRNKAVEHSEMNNHSHNNTTELRSHSMYSLDKTCMSGLDQSKLIPLRSSTMQSRFGVSETHLHCPSSKTDYRRNVNNVVGGEFDHNCRRSLTTDSAPMRNSQIYNRLRQNTELNNRVHSSEQVNILSRSEIRRNSCLPNRTGPISSSTSIPMNVCRRTNLMVNDNRRLVDRPQSMYNSMQNCEHSKHDSSLEMNPIHNRSADHGQGQAHNNHMTDHTNNSMHEKSTSSFQSSNSKSVNQVPSCTNDLSAQLHKFLLDGPETIQMELLLRIADLQTRLSTLELCRMDNRWIAQSDLINLQTDYQTLNNFYDLAKRYWNQHKRDKDSKVLRFDANQVLHSVLAQFQNRLGELEKFVQIHSDITDQESSKSGHDQLKIYRTNVNKWDTDYHTKDVNEHAECDDDDDDGDDDDEESDDEEEGDDGEADGDIVAFVGDGVVDVDEDEEEIDEQVESSNENEHSTDGMIHKPDKCNQPVNDSGVLSSPSSLPSRSEIGRCSSNSPHIQSPIVEESFSKLESVYLDLMQHYNKIKQLPMTPHRVEQLYNLMKRLYDIAVTVNNRSTIIATPEELEHMFQLDGDTRKLSEDLELAIKLQKQLTNCDSTCESTDLGCAQQYDKYSDHNEVKYPITNSHPNSNCSVHSVNIQHSNKNIQPNSSNNCSNKPQMNRSTPIVNALINQDGSSNQDSGLSTPPESFDGTKSRIKAHRLNSVRQNSRYDPLPTAKLVKNTQSIDLPSNSSKPTDFPSSSLIPETTHSTINTPQNECATKRIEELENTVFNLKRSLSHLSSKIASNNTTTEDNMKLNKQTDYVDSKQSLPDLSRQVSNVNIPCKVADTHLIDRQSTLPDQSNVYPSYPSPVEVHPTRTYRRIPGQSLQMIAPVYTNSHPVIMKSGKQRSNSVQRIITNTHTQHNTHHRSGLPNRMPVNRFSGTKNNLDYIRSNNVVISDSDCSTEGDSVTVGSSDESDKDNSDVVHGANNVISTNIPRSSKFDSNHNSIPLNSVIHEHNTNHKLPSYRVIQASPCYSYSSVNAKPHSDRRTHYGSLNNLNRISKKEVRMTEQYQSVCDPISFRPIGSIHQNFGVSMPHIANVYNQSEKSQVYNVLNEGLSQPPHGRGSQTPSSIRLYPPKQRILSSHRKTESDALKSCLGFYPTKMAILSKCDTCDGRGHVIRMNTYDGYPKSDNLSNDVMFTRSAFQMSPNWRKTLSTSKTKGTRPGPLRATHNPPITYITSSNDALLESERYVEPQCSESSSQLSFNTKRNHCNRYEEVPSSGLESYGHHHQYPNERQKLKQTKYHDNNEFVNKSRISHLSTNSNMLRKHHYSAYPQPKRVPSSVFSLKEALKTASTTSQLAHQLRQSLEDLQKSTK